MFSRQNEKAVGLESSLSFCGMHFGDLKELLLLFSKGLNREST